MDIPESFSEVAQFLIETAADKEFTASAQVRLKLIKCFLEHHGDVHAQNQSEDTMLTYACENGDTDLANLLLEFGAELEHESKDGVTPLMKACHAGHLYTVQLLISKGADVNRQTTNNDHTPLSLACAGGHLPVVELLLAEGANRYHKLRNNSTMIIEAVKEGHTTVVQWLLDYCPSKMLSQQGGAATMLPRLVGSQDSSLPTRTLFQSANFFQPPANLASSEFSSAFLQEDSEVVRIIPEEGTAQSQWTETINKQLTVPAPTCPTNSQQGLEHPDFLTEGPTVQQQHSYSPLSINAESNEKKQQILEELYQLEQDLQGLNAPSIEQEYLVIQEETQNNLLAASTFQRSSNSPQLLTARAAFVHSPQQEPCLELYDQAQETTTKTLEQKEKDLVEKVELTPALIEDVQTLESLHNINEVTQQVVAQDNITVSYISTEGQAFLASLTEHSVLTFDESMIGSLHELITQANDSRLEYVVPTNGTQLPVQVADMFNMDQTGAIYQTGSQEGINIVQQRLVQSACLDITTNATVQSTDHCQVSCSQHLPAHEQQTVTHQVQAATQTPQPATVATESTKQAKGITVREGAEVKKDRLLLSNQTQTQYGPTFQQNQNLNYQIDPNSAITQYNGVDGALPSANCFLDLNSETEDNHDTALTLACAKGYEELVELLIKRGADIEHRDKDGFTPLIHASIAGHEKVVNILLKNGADIEAQSYNTNNTALGLAILHKNYKVVKLLLSRGANKEHRNKNDHTPLVLAAMSRDMNIVQVLLKHAVEINSRSTESESGTTALMMAAVRDLTAIVKLLLNMGSDIHAQMKANGNTALTLACCKGEYKNVSLLLDRGANIEHRTKADLTPLMEAANGGHVEIARILLCKGANINAAAVLSSGHTALTLASEKGYCHVVEFLLRNGATVEVKTKFGQSPLWLAANRGYLSVVKLLKERSADFDSQDNRNVSCLMGAFLNGHVEVVLWMINYVTQLPSDQEMNRYIDTINDKELFEKCKKCKNIIRAGKKLQAAKANKNASLLLAELDMEKRKEKFKKVAAARRREQKKKKKVEKREEKSRLIDENKDNETYLEDDDKKNMNEDTGRLDDEENLQESNDLQLTFHNGEVVDKEEVDSGTTASSQSSCSRNDVKQREKQKEKRKKKSSQTSSSNMKKSKVEFRDHLTSVKNGVATASKTHALHEKSYDTAKNLQLNQTSKKVVDKEEDDSGTTASSQSSCSSNDIKTNKRQKEKNKKKSSQTSSSYTKKSKVEFRDASTWVENGVTTASKTHSLHEKSDDTAKNLQLNQTSKKVVVKEEDDSGTTASSQSSCSSNDIKMNKRQKEKNKKKPSQTSSSNTKKSKVEFRDPPTKVGNGVATSSKTHSSQEKSYDIAKSLLPNHFSEKGLMFEDTPHLAKQNAFEAIGNESYVPARNKKSHLQHSECSPKQSSKGEAGGKKITVTTNNLRVKKASIPLNEISHVINIRCNHINAIGGAKAAHIEVEKQSKSQEEKIIPITGSVDTTKETHLLIKVPDDILQMLPKRNKSAAATSTLWDKAQLGTKKISVNVVKDMSQSVATTTTAQQKSRTTTMPFMPSTTAPSRSTAVTKRRGSIIATLPQITAPRLVAQDQKNAVEQLASNMKNITSYTTAIMTTNTTTTKVVTTTATQTFAAKLTEKASSNQTPVSVYKIYHYDNTSVTQSLNDPQVNAGPLLLHVTHTQTINNQTSPKLHHSTSTASVPPNITKHYQVPGKFPLFTNSSTQPTICTGAEHSMSANLRQSHNFIPQVQPALTPVATPHVDALPTTQISSNLTKQDYSVSNSMVQQTTQRQESESHKPINFAALTRGGTSKTTTTKFVDNNPPPQMDALKGPDYKGTAMCLHVSSKSSSNNTAPPSLPLTSGSNYQSFPKRPKNQSIDLSQANQRDMSMSSNHNCSSTEIPSQSVQHLAHSDTNLYKLQSAGFQESAATNMLSMPANDVQQCLLPSYHLSSSIQQCNYSQPQQQQPAQISTESITTSHLNPKASDFFVDPLPNKQPLQIYNAYLMGNENSSTLHAMNRSGMGNYHRSAMGTAQSSQPLWQLSQPFSQEQSELLSGMAGMTLHSISRTMGADILENGEELGTGNSSPAMSPNVLPPHNLHLSNGHYIKDHKQLQPIGAERSSTFQNPYKDNWMMSNDSEMIVGHQSADTTNIDRYPLYDYISHSLDSCQYGVPLENPHNYASGAPFQENLLQQQQVNNMSPLDFIPDEFWTMELPQFTLSKYD